MTRIETQTLFRSGEDGYHTYRIPAIAMTAGGAVLAFCEGRKETGSDTGQIEMLLKRSLDGGRTWSAQQKVWHDDRNTCGNPSPVIDPASGAVVLLATWNLGEDRESEIVACASRDTRRVFLLRSEDDGASWSAAAEITADAKRPEWTWYATGPGAGIALERGPHRGRLVIPCDHIVAGTEGRHSHVILSDDGGRSWRIGGIAPREGVNECMVAELSDGRLLLNMRNRERTQTHRQLAWSDDGGESWYGQRADATLVEPVCQASLRRLRWPVDGTPGVLLFSNPASIFTEDDPVRGRRNLTLRASVDDGESWPAALTLHAGPAAYSDLAILPDGTILCLGECGEERPAEGIRLFRVPPDALGV